jgi:hypothetical protein
LVYDFLLTQQAVILPYKTSNGYNGCRIDSNPIAWLDQWYMTGVVGTDGHTRLKFTPIEWAEEAFGLVESP